MKPTGSQSRMNWILISLNMIFSVNEIGILDSNRSYIVNQLYNITLEMNSIYM